MDGSKNYVTRNYGCQIGSRYVTTCNGKPASLLFDIRCLETKSNPEDFVGTHCLAIVGFHKLT